MYVSLFNAGNVNEHRSTFVKIKDFARYSDNMNLFFKKGCSSFFFSCLTFEYIYMLKCDH